MEETKRLTETCIKIDGVLSVDSLRARKSGPYLFVEVNIGVDGLITASAAHRIAALTKNALLEEHQDRVAGAIVHVNPIGAKGIGHNAPPICRSIEEVTKLVEIELRAIHEITSVCEVQIYYTDDGNIKLKVLPWPFIIIFFSNRPGRRVHGAHLNCPRCPRCCYQSGKFDSAEAGVGKISRC